MALTRWLSNRLGRSPRPASRPKTPNARRVFRPTLERLDDRCLPSAGALDPNFGNGAGYVATTSLSQDESWANAALMQPDGKIIAAGMAQVGAKTQQDDFAVVRYQANASLDTTFGGGGYALADFPGAFLNKRRHSIANAAALYPQAGTANDGKIVLVGEHWTTSGSDFVLARFNANGTLDSTFGSDKKNPGEVTTTIPTASNDWQSAFGVVVLPDGRIVAAGIGAGGFVLARYKANGALDANFGSGGEVVTPFSGVMLDAGTLLMQPDGKLIVVGEEHSASGTWVVTMARYKSDGSLDTAFGSGGVVTGPVLTDYGVKAALYPPGTANAGKMVIVGQTPGQNLEICASTPMGPPISRSVPAAR